MPRRRLITERDVLRAHREGATTIDSSGAVVTPAARDAAAARGIALAGGLGSSSATNPAVTPVAPHRTSPSATLPPRSPLAPQTTSAPSTTAASSTAASATVASGRQRLAIGADHGGVTLKDALIAFVRDRGHSVNDLGTFGSDAVDYPVFALAVARSVAEGRADLGIMVDGAGIGSCMVANKVPGVRAALCHDVTTAANAREHNHANVLTLGGGLVGTRLALEIVRVFLDTPFAGGRHPRRVDMIDALLPLTPLSNTARK